MVLQGLGKALTGLIVCLGFFGVMRTEALAVAGKTVTASAGASLAGATLEFELTDGTSVTAQVDQQGQIQLPDNVNRETVRNCYRKEQTATGETKQRIDCAGWLPIAGGAAAIGSAGSNWASLSDRRRHSWTFDAMVTLGGSTSLGSTDATTTANVNGTQSFSSGLSGLSGVTGGLMFRAHLPLDWTGPLGDVWGFFRWNEHFNQETTGGYGSVHPTPGDDVSTTFKRGRDLEVGLGKSFETLCHANGACQYFGVYAGASFQQNKTTVSWNETGGGGVAESTSSQVWQTSVVTGAWYQFPLSNLGTGWDMLSAVLGVDFRRIPNMNVNGRSSTFSNFSYIGSIDPWEVTGWAGLGMAF